MVNRRRKNRPKFEGFLAIFYFGAVLASITLSTVIAIVWRYWKDVLNNCIDAQCNCILYATALTRSVRGSSSALCKAVTFVPVPIAIWGCLIGSYHAYRVCIQRKKYSTPNKRRSGMFGAEETRIPRKQHKSSCHICLFLIAIIVAILSSAIAFVVAHGYYSTCSSYRTAIVKHLSASGNLAGMVNDRMTCGSVYDFLDYIQPDPDYLEAKLRRGTYIINTGLLLQLAILSAWLSVLAWMAISALNLFLIFKS